MGGEKSRLTLTEVDELLDELAAPSPFSQMSLPPSPARPQQVIIQALYRDARLSPYALAVLTQIILRDLRPLLAPLPASHPTTMLRCKITSAPEQLSVMSAMHAWDPAMARMYRDGKGCLDYCADMVERVRHGACLPPGPVVGVNVQVSSGRGAELTTDSEMLQG